MSTVVLKPALHHRRREHPHLRQNFGNGGAISVFCCFRPIVTPGAANFCSFRLTRAPLLITIRASSTTDTAAVERFEPAEVSSKEIFSLRRSEKGGAYDRSEDLYGLDVDLQPRNPIADASVPRSWFGPNGQYIKELPCPSCRGRGYTPCTECGVERSRSDCPQCNGKGIMTCHQCLGDCVIWEESIDERPWEKAQSISPLKVKEDDDVDKLDIKLDVKRKPKRVYRSSSPEVNLKISRSLKSLNAKTGLFSKRMKIIHRDPKLHAQRVAAIKKTKGTAAARKHASEAMKAFFSNPENRRKRSLSMKGVKFYCRHCGREGHRSYYCPELRESSTDRRFRCRLCGGKGHNRRTCPRSKATESKTSAPRHHNCKVCGQSGHNRRTCPLGFIVKSQYGDEGKEDPAP